MLSSRTIIRRSQILSLIAVMLLLGACATAPTPTPTPAIPEEIVFAGWEGDFPQSVLSAFEEEYGIHVRYVGYDTQDMLLDWIRSGEAIDVAILDNDLIQSVVGEGLLVELNLANIPNLANIDENFRDLVVDPGNRHSVPFTWGTVGIYYRPDLVSRPPERWVDLWRPEYVGKIALWDLGATNVAITLKALGYSINSEDPAELDVAEARLLELAPSVVAVADSPESMAELVSSGRAALAVGSQGEALQAAESSEIVYVLPDEGAYVWIDHFVIPSTSRNRQWTEAFINFSLSSEMGAEIVENGLYSTPNRAAHEFVDLELLTNPILFPAMDQLRFSTLEFVLPSSTETLARIDAGRARVTPEGIEPSTNGLRVRCSAS